jgi:hypothetical protein
MEYRGSQSMFCTITISLLGEKDGALDALTAGKHSYSLHHCLCSAIKPEDMVNRSAVSQQKEIIKLCNSYSAVLDLS